MHYPGINVQQAVLAGEQGGCSSCSLEPANIGAQAQCVSPAKGPDSICQSRCRCVMAYSGPHLQRLVEVATVVDERAGLALYISNTRTRTGHSPAVLLHRQVPTQERSCMQPSDPPYLQKDGLQPVLQPLLSASHHLPQSYESSLQAATTNIPPGACMAGV